MGIPFILPLTSDMPANPRVVLDVVVGSNGEVQVQVAHFNCSEGWPQAAVIIQTGLSAAMNQAFEALTTERPRVDIAQSILPRM